MKALISLTEQSAFEVLAKSKSSLQLGEIAKLLFIDQKSTEYGKLKRLLEKMERRGLINMEAYKDSPCQRCIGKKMYSIKSPCTHS